EFMSSPTLCENRLDAPKRCAGKSKPAQAGRAPQKVSALLIHAFLLVVKIPLRKGADYSTPVRLADEAAALARRLRGPAASGAPQPQATRPLNIAGPSMVPSRPARPLMWPPAMPATPAA